jgi:site-specific DNA recombinase
MPTIEQPVYAVYCRLSRKKYIRRRGRRRNPDETVVVQEAIIRKYAAEKGLAISEAHIYIDNHRSAWKATGRREGWNAMMAAGRRHEFDGLLAYKTAVARHFR